MDHRVLLPKCHLACSLESESNAHVTHPKVNLADLDNLEEPDSLETTVALAIQADLVKVETLADLETKAHLETLEVRDNPDHLVSSVPEDDHHLDLPDSLVALDRLDQEDHLVELETTETLVVPDNPDPLDNLAVLALPDNLATQETVGILEVVAVAITVHQHVWLLDINRNLSQALALLIFYMVELE